MDITDADGKWRLTDRQIENQTTGEIRRLKRTPSAYALAIMAYGLFLKKCSIAFNTGEWPQTHWASGKISD